MASIMLAGLLTTSVVCPAMAMEVPVSSSAAEINGQQVLTEVYEVDAALDPTTLIKEDFTRGDLVYSYDKITKQETERIEVKEHTEEVSVQSNTKDLEKNIKLFEPTIEYKDEEGYEGTLHIDINSIETTTDGYKSTSSKLQEVKTYTGLEYNDPSLVPSTIQKNGKTLTAVDIQFAGEGDVVNGSIPASYSATVTYSKTLYSKVPTGYTVKASYSGEVEKKDLEDVTYTVTYLGSEAQPELLSDASQDDPNILGIMLLGLGALLVIAGLLYFLVRKGILHLPKKVEEASTEEEAVSEEEQP